MAWINAYGCGKGCPLGNLFGDAPLPTSYLFEGERAKDVKSLLVGKLLESLVRPSGRYGVILASTKGISNDFIWGENSLERDPLTPLLEEFLKASELQPVRSVCVSNACSSALGAMALAQDWLKDLDEVLIVAADAVTPFVEKGFRSLNLITSDRPRPFDTKRSGFFLGDAAATILLSNKPSGLWLHPIGLDTEGSAVTRPSQSGESLVRAARAIGADLKPDVIIAHGTGTPINDETEDLAFAKLFPDGTPPITASKWATGHTLGASAAIDTILACEILKRGYAFGLRATEQIDPAFKGRYMLKPLEGDFKSVLISSLGFGGMHAMALVEKR